MFFCVSRVTACVHLCYSLQACDRSAVVWDARSGRCELKYEGLKGDINAVRFFPSGEMLGAACNDGSVSYCVPSITLL